ncbi:MAG: hypothetical protein WEB90_03240 [Gemmatimonadota bacterium]
MAFTRKSVPVASGSAGIKRPLGRAAQWRAREAYTWRDAWGANVPGADVRGNGSATVMGTLRVTVHWLTTAGAAIVIPTLVAFGSG